MVLQVLNGAVAAGDQSLDCKANEGNLHRCKQLQALGGTNRMYDGWHTPLSIVAVYQKTNSHVSCRNKPELFRSIALERMLCLPAGVAVKRVKHGCKGHFCKSRVLP